MPCNSKVRPQKPIILAEFNVICRSWNLKRNVGPKTKDFVTWQFYPKLTTFCRLCRSILIIFWDCKIKFISRTLSLWLHFLIGGFYSDTIAFVNDSCLRCPNGTFVPYSKTPGKSTRECIACPQGRDILSSNLVEHRPRRLYWWWQGYQIQICMLACSMGSEFRAADSQHSIRLREIVFDSFWIKFFIKLKKKNKIILTICWWFYCSLDASKNNKNHQKTSKCQLSYAYKSTSVLIGC